MSALLRSGMCAIFGMASTVAIAAGTISYTYDARGRLVQVQHSGSINNGVISTYTHDKADNRTSATTTGASH